MAVPTIVSRRSQSTFLVIVAFVALIIFVTTYIPKGSYYTGFLQPSVESRRDAIPGIQSDKWIVLTTSQAPTDEVKFMTSLPGWRVVVVGDTKTPGDWRHPNCVYISVEEQQQFNYSLSKLTVRNEYSRKNIGYLYAITNGAKYIYDTDDNMRPLDKFESFQLDANMRGLMYSGDNMNFNPYQHFGQLATWPRDFPPSGFGAYSHYKYSLSENWRTPSIQQGLMANDRDTGTSFKRRRKTSSKDLNITFDPAAPPVILPPGVFSPLNSQDTLFLQDAFWALVLPTSTMNRASILLRGYWAQRLLWEIGGTVGFFNSRLNHKGYDNMQRFGMDNDDQINLHFDTDQLSTFLTNWICPDDLSFFACAYKLSTDMVKEKFLDELDSILVHNWLQDLVDIGYQEPKRIKYSMQEKHITQMVANNPGLASFIKVPTGFTHLQKMKYMVTSKGIKTVFAPAQPFSTPKAHYSFRASNHFHLFSKLCPSLSSIQVEKFTMQPKPSQSYDDILLIVVYNWPKFENTKYLDVIYRPVFPNILYCGVNTTQFQLDTNERLDRDVSFVEVPNISKGFFGPWCSVRAMQMNYNVKGYLAIGDDALFNMWTLKTFDKNKIWKIPPIVYDLNKEPNPPGWYWWTGQYGKRRYFESINSLKLIQKSLTFPKNLNLTPDQFLSQMAYSNGGANSVTRETGDIYYIPQRLKHDAIFYLSHFLSRETFQGICIPNIMNGLDKAENAQILNGLNLWNVARKNPWGRFNTTLNFIHPIKLSMEENVQSLCNVFLPNLISNVYAVN